MARKLHKFTNKSATALLFIAEDKTAKLTSVYSKSRQNGHATLLMRDVIEFADKNGLTLWLEVQRYGYSDSKSLDNSGLETFYSKFGFSRVNDGNKPVMMHRYPSSER